jgi:hypothetical protein
VPLTGLAVGVFGLRPAALVVAGLAVLAGCVGYLVAPSTATAPVVVEPAPAPAAA